MANIRLSPDQLRTYANKLRKNGNDAISLANDISGNINSCAGEWEGQQREKFVAGYNNIKPTLTQKLPELIDEMARTLDTIAQNFENADQA